MTERKSHTFKHVALLAGIAAAVVAAPTQAAGEWSANASMTNNYIWRGLTQTENEAAVQGGIDYADESGFYIGTWVSNVNYGAADVYSYEHDVYAGYAFETGDVSWDVGYLYYNYDSAANFDFGEAYVNVGIGGLGLGLYMLTNTEADEAPGQDFDAFGTYYASVDYGFQVGNGVDVGLHVGYHDGDFAEAFNGTEDGYFDYGISFAKDGFSFTITDTNVKGDFAAGPTVDNAAVKFVVAYSVDVSL
jgi:uncharacterized protein (TIGR02001 family)